MTDSSDSMRVRVTSDPEVGRKTTEGKTYDDLLEDLKTNKENPEALKKTKESLKKTFGLDVDQMKIYKVTRTGGIDQSSSHSVKLYRTRFGKEQQVNVNEFLPSDAAKADFLFAQQQVFFPVLGTRKIYSADIEYKFSGEKIEEGSPELQLQSMKVTKSKPAEGLTSIFRNIRNTETWSPSDIGRKDETAKAALSQSESLMKKASQSVTAMPLSDFKEKIIKPAVAEESIKEFKGFANNNSLMEHDLKFSSQVVVGLLAKDPEKLTDKDLKQFMEHVEQCGKETEIETKFLSLPDRVEDEDGKVVPNEDKINGFKTFVARFQHYCETKVNFRKSYSEFSKVYSGLQPIKDEFVKKKAEFKKSLDKKLESLPKDETQKKAALTKLREEVDTFLEEMRTLITKFDTAKRDSLAAWNDISPERKLENRKLKDFLDSSESLNVDERSFTDKVKQSEPGNELDEEEE